jgi:hypothetical protein
MSDLLPQAQGDGLWATDPEAASPIFSSPPRLSTLGVRPHASSTGSAVRTEVQPDCCNFCSRLLGPRLSTGRRRAYCSQSCRQRAYQSRKRSRELGLGDGMIVVSDAQTARLVRRINELLEAVAVVETAGLHSNDMGMQRLCAASRKLGDAAVGASLKGVARKGR